MPTDTFTNLPIEKRNLILHLAIEEFAGHPYHAASISNIVREAGIAKGSFYQYFADKKACYRYLVEMATKEKLNIVTEIPAPDPGCDLFGYLRWQFLTQVHFELTRPRLAQILYRAFIEDIPFPDMAEELRRRGTTQFFKQLLSQGILHGTVAPWVDPDVAAFLTEVIFYQFGKYFIERLSLTKDDFTSHAIYDRQDVQALLTSLMDILEAGIKRNPNQQANYLRVN
ncbi:MAG: TetR/AcrR family transcriptional regulator [Brevefilum sp.]|nr:TetR/AcrR family transcriptional regulator [Brevefilum sp.]